MKDEMKGYVTGRSHLRIAKMVNALMIGCVLSMGFFPGMSSPKGHSIRQEEINEDTLKVLAMGNSFSQDALEFYLQPLAQAAHIPVIIGNLSIGGASLALHWENADNNRAVYAYKKISSDGKKQVWSNVSMDEALSDEEWDFVSFQQVSQNAGRWETLVEPLPRLYSYVNNKLKRKKTKFIFHQTWAYAQDATHGGFKQYNYNQYEMYRSIADVSARVRELIPVDRIVPCGTAIQNGRTSSIGDKFCRDGFHLDVNIGRYTAAATWYEVLFGRSVVGNIFRPEGLSAYEAELAQQAAHSAVLKPYEITDLVNYK